MNQREWSWSPPTPTPTHTHTHAHITATLIKYRSRVPVKNQYKKWEMYQIKYKESVTLHTRSRIDQTTISSTNIHQDKNFKVVI